MRENGRRSSVVGRRSSVASRGVLPRHIPVIPREPKRPWGSAFRAFTMPLREQRIGNADPHAALGMTDAEGAPEATTDDRRRRPTTDD
jgi:hypothetical protein